MTGDSLNLIEMIREYIPAGLTDTIASLFGESREKTQLGMNAALPGILSGLVGATSTPEGARRLTDAVDGADDSILSNPSGLLGKLGSSDSGLGMIRSVLGAGGLSELTGNIGRTSGLSGKGTTGLLSFLAPLILGVLKNIKNTKGFDSAGLTSLLGSQRNNIAAAMPEGMPDQIGSVTEPASYIREAPRSYTASGSEHHGRETYPREVTGTGSRGWVLPLIVFLGLIGLLWYWASRPSTHAGNEPGSVSGRTGSLSVMAKYRSVIDEARAQGVRLSTLEQQNGKLVIKGTAPSLEAANKVWDQIKRVNPSMDDIVADFQVNASMLRVSPLVRSIPADSGSLAYLQP
jgi:hypothetical protein